MNNYWTALLRLRSLLQHNLPQDLPSRTLHQPKNQNFLGRNGTHPRQKSSLVADSGSLDTNCTPCCS